MFDLSKNEIFEIFKYDIFRLLRFETFDLLKYEIFDIFEYDIFGSLINEIFDLLKYEIFDIFKCEIFVILKNESFIFTFYSISLCLIIMKPAIPRVTCHLVFLQTSAMCKVKRTQHMFYISLVAQTPRYESSVTWTPRCSTCMFPTRSKPCHIGHRKSMQSNSTLFNSDGLQTPCQSLVT